MQDVLTFAFDSIALAAGFYFTVGLILHLVHCWQQQPVKIAPEFDLLETIDPCGLLKEAEPIACRCATARSAVAVALLSPAPLPEFVAAVPVDVAPIETAIDYASLSSIQLRKLCRDRGIRWRGVKAGKHLSKPEMLAVLAAQRDR